MFLLTLLAAIAASLYLSSSDEVADEDMAASSGSSLRDVDGKWHVVGVMDDEKDAFLITDIDSTTTRAQQGSYNSNMRGVGGSGELIDDRSGKKTVDLGVGRHSVILVVNGESFVLSQTRILDVAEKKLIRRAPRHVYQYASRESSLACCWR